MDNNITQEEFIERITNGETCFSGYYFENAVITTVKAYAELFDRARRSNLTFDKCTFERLELSCIILDTITICNCNIYNLIIEDCEIRVSSIFDNKISYLEVKDSHIDECDICNIHGNKKSTIHNTSIRYSRLHDILIGDMIFSNNEISNTAMINIKSYTDNRIVFMLSMFARNRVFSSVINKSYFYRCNFIDTIISESIICDSIMYESNITDTIRSACPTTGSFIGYKIVKTISKTEWSDDYTVVTVFDKHMPSFLIAVLEIPEDAKRSSAYTNKCRADKVKVLRFENIDGTECTDVIEAMSASYKGSKTIYKVGEMVYADEFDEKPYNECSNGIHFFVDRRSAVEYLGLI